jgi:hypothetical protein
LRAAVSKGLITPEFQNRKAGGSIPPLDDWKRFKSFFFRPFFALCYLTALKYSLQLDSVILPAAVEVFSNLKVKSPFVVMTTA